MSGDPSAVLQAAKNQLTECDREIGAIRAVLRGLGPAPADTEGAGEGGEPANELTVEWLNPVEGEELTMELSSPVEEVVLNAANAYKTSFRGVETGQATLSVSGGDANVDVAEFTVQLLDALAPASEYVTTKSIGTTASTTKSTEGSTAATTNQKLQFTYRPSKKDQREELYELLNRATQRKATAREDLRQAAANMPSAAITPANSGKLAVQAGFLNKTSVAPVAPPKWKIWYRRLVVIVPIAKNYILFGGFLVFSHFQGQYMAIPPPV